VPAGTTTQAPAGTTTHAPAGTTTKAPAGTTTHAPAGTTTQAPAGTTTHAPAGTTTQAPAGTTTHAPAGTTTQAPAGTTTHAPAGTTTQAPSGTTTKAPGAAPTITKVTVKVDPDDNADHHDHSIQVASDVTLKLTWETSGATGMEIENLGSFGASDTTDLPTKDASYSLVAKADGGASSDPWALEVHTHDPGQVVSPHVDLGAGVAGIVSFQATKDDQSVTSGKVGDELVLLAVVSDATESVKIADQDCELSDNGDGHKKASLKVTLAADKHTFDCQAIKDGKAADTQSVQIDLSSDAAPVPRLSVDPLGNVKANSAVTFKWTIDNFVATGTTAQLSADGDPGDSSFTSSGQDVTLGASGGGELAVTPTKAGDFNFTLKVTPPSGTVVSTDALKVTVEEAKEEDKADITDFTVENEQKESAKAGGSVAGEKGKPVKLSVKATEATKKIVINTADGVAKQFDAAEGEADVTVDKTTVFSAVAFDQAGTASDPQTITVTVTEKAGDFKWSPVGPDAELFKTEIFKISKSIFELEAAAVLKISGEVSYKLDDGEANPDTADLKKKLLEESSVTDVTSALPSLLDLDKNLSWEGEGGFKEFAAVATSHTPEGTEGTIAEFVLYKGELKAPGSDTATVEVEVKVGAVKWNGEEAKLVVLPITVGAAFPVIKISALKDKMACSLEVELEVEGSVDTKMVLADVIGVDLAETVVGELFDTLMLPLLAAAIWVEIIRVWGKSKDNAADIQNAKTIIEGFKTAYADQLKASAAGGAEKEPEGDGAMAKMVQKQGFKSAAAFYDQGSQQILAAQKSKDWIEKGKQNGKSEDDLKKELLAAFNKKVTDNADSLAAKAYTNAYNRVGQTMVDFIDLDGLGLFHDDQVAMAQALGTTPPSSTYDVYVANYNKKYTKDGALPPLEKRAEIPYTEAEWNALPADKKETFKSNPDYKTTIDDVSGEPGMSAGPVLTMTVKDKPGDPNYESGVESFHTVTISADDYLKQHNAFDGTLVVGDKRIAGKAMDIDTNGNGTFYSDGKLINFSPPNYVEGHKASPHAPPPTQNVTQDEMRKAGILSWNEPSHLDANKGVVKERGFKAKLVWGKNTNIGKAAMTGNRMTSEGTLTGCGIFLSDDESVVIEFCSPAQAVSTEAPKPKPQPTPVPQNLKPSDDDDTKKKAGILDWNDPDKGKQYKDMVDTDRSFDAVVHFSNLSMTGLCRASGNETIFVDDSGNNWLRFVSPAYAVKIAKRPGPPKWES